MLWKIRDRRDVVPRSAKRQVPPRSDMRVNHALIDINRKKIQTGRVLQSFSNLSEQTDENENRRASPITCTEGRKCGLGSRSGAAANSSRSRPSFWPLPAARKISKFERTN